jgi:hypothetical protein
MLHNRQTYLSLIRWSPYADTVSGIGMKSKVPEGDQSHSQSEHSRKKNKARMKDKQHEQRAGNSKRGRMALKLDQKRSKPRLRRVLRQLAG